jgi:hypothetical protein
MPQATRRRFMGRLIAVTTAAASSQAFAQRQVDEADENAVALGYKHDTTKVDAKKYPKHAATQRCSNCAFWQGAANDPWAGCAMFGRKQIANAGWCAAWAKQPS